MTLLMNQQSKQFEMMQANQSKPRDIADIEAIAKLIGRWNGKGEAEEPWYAPLLQSAVPVVADIRDTIKSNARNKEEAKAELRAQLAGSVPAPQPPAAPAALPPGIDLDDEIQSAAYRAGRYLSTCAPGDGIDTETKADDVLGILGDEIALGFFTHQTPEAMATFACTILPSINEAHAVEVLTCARERLLTEDESDDDQDADDQDEQRKGGDDGQADDADDSQSA